MSVATSLTSLHSLLKDRYGPTFEAKGTYAAVCAWLGLAGRIRYMSMRDVMPSASWCRRHGVEVEEYDRISALMYKSNPFLALISKAGGEPIAVPDEPPEPIDSIDVEGWQRPTRVSRDGESGPRDPFTPEEAEHRRRDAMDLTHDECPLCIADMLEGY